MKVKGWNNGSPNTITGAGYGIRINKKEDRDRYFQKTWKEVIIILDDKKIKINLSQSFWKKCKELRKKEIGRWMLEKGIAPWSKGNPPELELIPEEDNRFLLKLVE
ncbi:MAG: hypothetical protein GXO99_02510 [Nitrospirae bacterium]|nr:hypothetical protein [Nitrospirota bacterium]